MHLTHALLVAALGVTAHPSGHGAHHLAHRAALDKRGQFFKAVHKTVTVTVPAAAPSPDEATPKPQDAQAEATAAAPPAPSVDHLSASGSATMVVNAPTDHAPQQNPPEAQNPAPRPSNDPEGALKEYDPVCTKSYKTKRASLLDIAYTGNIGSGDNYGCNLKFVSCSLYDKYANGAKLVNKGGDSMVVVVSNKMGPGGEIAFGQFSANQDHLIHFVMAPGQEACIGIADDSQGQIIWAPGTDIAQFPKSNNGQYQGVMMEFDVHNEKNQAWSGADCSCLVAADTGNLAIPGCKVALDGGKTCSEIFAGTQGTGVKAYTAGKNDVDGEGCNWNDKTIKIDVTLS